MRPTSVASLIIVSVLLLVTLGTTGCKHSFSSPFQIRGLRVDGEIFHVKASKMIDSTVQFSFVGPATLRTKDRTIRYVDMAVGITEDAMFDTVAFAVMHTGDVGGVGAQTIGNAVWDSPTAKMSTSAVADIGVLTSSDHLVFRQVVVYTDPEPLLLTPFVTTVTDTTVEIGALAKRVFVPTGEYLPSSENFRIIISDSKGIVQWRSDAGLAFLSMVGSVEPKQINQVQRYALVWNGRDAVHNMVPDGEYNVEFVIPARPKPYSTQTTLLWPPR